MRSLCKSFKHSSNWQGIVNAPKVVNFCTNWNPLYQLVINCNLSCISGCFPDVTLLSQTNVPRHVDSVPQSRFKFSSPAYRAKSRFIFLFSCSENRVMLTSVVLSQYTSSQATTVVCIFIILFCHQQANHAVRQRNKFHKGRQQGQMPTMLATYSTIRIIFTKTIC